MVDTLPIRKDKPDDEIDEELDKIALARIDNKVDKQDIEQEQKDSILIKISAIIESIYIR